MKTKLLLVIIAAFAISKLALAQTNAPPVASLDATHTSLAQLWVFAVAAITPIILAGVKLAIPNVPSALIPCVAPVVGILIGFGLNALGGAHLAWVDMAIAGGLGVTIREIVDQAIIKQIGNGPPSSPH
jgi:hypothetical protein